MRFVGIRLMTTRASRPTPAIFVLEVPPRSRTGRRESWRTRMTLGDIEGHSPNASIPSLACCNCAVKTYIILSECQIPCCSAPWTGCRMLFAFMRLSESLRRLAIQRLITIQFIDRIFVSVWPQRPSASVSVAVNRFTLGLSDSERHDCLGCPADPVGALLQARYVAARLFFLCPV